ncbi:MAG: hypothetical protein IH936_16325 [Acidobacteria bacterium]|nr:hypothetical protein [Acidobacteriota bacterium]
MRRARQTGSQPWALGPLLWALAILWINVERIEAGSFLSVNEGLPNAVTHPSNYDPTVGGVVTVSVCIDPAAPHAAAMEIPVKNIVRVINDLTPVSPNLILGAFNNIPIDKIDFESLTLHEFGHCIGLHHPNVGVQAGVSGPPFVDADFTQSGDGANNDFSFNETSTIVSDGADGVIGSSDDVRSDDVNFHWFVGGVNNPFAALPPTIDSTTYTRTGSLPGGHTFAANAGRAVGTLLGIPDTEAVMQQGQFFDEDQRALQADDVATLRFAMAGLDELTGTGDDYTINMVYAGMTTICDIRVESGPVGLGECATGVAFTDPTFADLNHLTITSAVFTYEPGRTDWFFNQVVGGCGVGNDTLAVTGMDTGVETYEACVSITIGAYTAGASSMVTARAPLIVIENDTTLGGTFVAENALP